LRLSRSVQAPIGGNQRDPGSAQVSTPDPAAERETPGTQPEQARSR